MNGCSATASAMVNSVSGPSVTISPGVTISHGTSTTLSATGGGSYLWMPPGSLSCSSCKNPIASPSITTTYYVIITDSLGCTATDSVTITVIENCDSLFIPNAFSPNNDGENDVFCLYGTSCIETLQLTIYNRWGEKVIQTLNPKDCWSGVFKNQEADTGIFVYQLIAIFKNKKQLNIKGNISLVR